MRLGKREGERPGLWQKIRDVAFTDVNVLARGLDEGSLEKIEETLLAADFGVPATMQLVDVVEAESRSGRIRTEQEFVDVVEREILNILGEGGAPANGGQATAPAPTGSVLGSLFGGRGNRPNAPAPAYAPLTFAAEPPTVFLMVGVNGVGKTTTIGKLANRLKGEGKRVLLAAGDTFRAGAIDQLRLWADRVGVEFVGAQPGADPASVAFDAIDAAVNRRSDVVIIDTAGRLHTQGDLMTELAKIGRVVDRKLPGAPHETLLVLDATVGQNAVAQARTFRQALPLTGLVLAKMDSTARGGIVVALKKEFDLPVKLVGTGEGVDALEPFDAAGFARAVLEG
ncbi:MAG TPA: signal recognition particle-docking protein FtsY [Longimicrobiales bacterium]|nr:signal recognition particle-docking protein FtsY [Longimicrobiales bacterium]